MKKEMNKTFITTENSDAFYNDFYKEHDGYYVNGDWYDGPDEVIVVADMHKENPVEIFGRILSGWEIRGDEQVYIFVGKEATLAQTLVAFLLAGYAKQCKNALVMLIQNESGEDTTALFYIGQIINQLWRLNVKDPLKGILALCEPYKYSD